MQTLYLIRGIPGSGKSTLAYDLQYWGVVDEVFEADQYFYDREGNYNFDSSKLHLAHNECQKKTIDTLEQGYNVAVSNTSTTLSEVNTYKEIAKLTKSKFISLIVENRHGGVNIHNVPEEKLKQMKERFHVEL